MSYIFKYRRIIKCLIPICIKVLFKKSIDIKLSVPFFELQYLKSFKYSLKFLNDITEVIMKLFCVCYQMFGSKPCFLALLVVSFPACCLISSSPIISIDKTKATNDP